MINIDKGVKNIIFDFGGVILDIDMNKSVEAFAKLGITGFKADDIHPNTRSFFEELEMGKLTTPQFFEHVLSEYGGNTQKVSQRDLFEAWSALLLPFDSKKVAVIERLHNDKKYNLYLLSNTNYPHRVRFLNNFTRQFGYDMETLFEKCYYSDELEMRKPDANIYKYVLKDAGLKAEETLFIDDNQINLPSAEECGIHTYHLNLKQGNNLTMMF